MYTSTRVLASAHLLSYHKKLTRRQCHMLDWAGFKKLHSKRERALALLPLFCWAGLSEGYIADVGCISSSGVAHSCSRMCPTVSLHGECPWVHGNGENFSEVPIALQRIALFSLHFTPTHARTHHGCKGGTNTHTFSPDVSNASSARER